MEENIKRELIVPYNPEQNGVEERKNRSSEESVKVMLHDQDLPKFLWGEATKTTVYIQNRGLHRSLDNKTPEEVFTGKKPAVDHLRIFGCLVYIHILKDKRKKLDQSGMNGTFVGYNNSSKTYRIYLKGHQIEVSRDVIFDVIIALKKSKDLPMDFNDDELLVFELEVTREEEESNHEDEGPCEPIQPVTILEYIKRPHWLKSTLLDAEVRGTTQGTLRESKKPKRYSRYATHMTKIIEVEPSIFEEAVNHQEWNGAMNEEYQSIMKNGVWEIVPRPKDKSVVTSRGLYKIKHATDESIDKYKARFVARSFSQQEGINYEETFAPTTRYTTIRLLVSLATSMA